MSRYYRMFDPEPRGMFATPREELGRWNEKQFGIFWTLCRFKGPRRIENLERIDTWAVDIDSGTKEEQRERIQASPLVPSLVVETKRGYHVYWRAKDARKEHWPAIVEHRLVPFFGADKNAKDLARVLRAPCFVHWKDPAEPFIVREVHRWDVSYSELELAYAFPEKREETPEQRHHETRRRELPASSGDFWERVYALDCAEGLRRLSGSSWVCGEEFSFRPVRDGNLNVFVNGKSTSCWVDRNGRIGSLSDGGPTLYQWLRWYKHPPKFCVDAIKAAFPELRDL